MTPLIQAIDSLRRRPDIGVLDQTSSWSIIITKGPDFLCEVTVPHTGLEWFACVKHRRDLNELWSDWMDYSGYDHRTRHDLEAEMARDILSFINRVSASELKLPLEIWEEEG